MHRGKCICNVLCCLFIISFWSPETHRTWRLAKSWISFHTRTEKELTFIRIFWHKKLLEIQLDSSKKLSVHQSDDCVESSCCNKKKKNQTQSYCVCVRSIITTDLLLPNLPVSPGSNSNTSSKQVLFSPNSSSFFSSKFSNFNSPKFAHH